MERVDKTMRVRWALNEDQVLGYHVETNRIGSMFGWTRVTETIIHDNFYDVHNLEFGKLYKFRVIVLKNCTEFVGEDSETIEVLGEFSLKLT